MRTTGTDIRLLTGIHVQQAIAPRIGAGPFQEDVVEVGQSGFEFEVVLGLLDDV